MARRDDVPVYTGGGGGGGRGGSSGNGGSSGGGRSGGSGGRGGKSGGGGGGTGNAALDRQLKKQNRQEAATRRNFLSQSKILQGQAKALRKALGADGFRNALDQRLRNIAQDLAQQDSLLMEGYSDRVGSLEGAASDNEKAASDQSYANLSNRARERSNAVSQALSQGAGESDTLRAEQMSLRSWDANQGEINRGFHDTLRSINSSLTDLNVDTKTGRSNLYLQAGEDREQAWTTFYNQMSEGWTQLGNVYGQAANNQGQAAIYGTKAKKKDKLSSMKQNETRAVQAFQNASKFAGKAYADPGIPAEIMGWEGEAPVEGTMSNSTYVQDDTSAPRKKPEGATLRSWT